MLPQKMHGICESQSLRFWFGRWCPWKHKTMIKRLKSEASWDDGVVGNGFHSSGLQNCCWFRIRDSFTRRKISSINKHPGFKWNHLTCTKSWTSLHWKLFWTCPWPSLWNPSMPSGKSRSVSPPWAAPTLMANAPPRCRRWHPRLSQSNRQGDDFRSHF